MWIFWNWPAEHRVNRLFAALEQQQFEKAYGIWNNDADWQQHTDKYKTSGYPYNRFLDDWNVNGEYGKITSHKILYATSSLGNSTLMAVQVNGRKSLLTLGVSHGAIGYTPFSLTPQKGQFGPHLLAGQLPVSTTMPCPSSRCDPEQSEGPAVCR